MMINKKIRKLVQPYLARSDWHPHLTLLLSIKILIMIWNAANYPSHQQYDVERHFTSVINGGLIVSVRNFDPPLYYLTTLPFIVLGKSFDIGVFQDLQFLLPLMKIYNIVLICSFYMLWIYWILPNLLPNRTARFAAGTIILALPGYQKLAVMIHADNLLTLLTTIIFSLWLHHKTFKFSWRWVNIWALLLSLTMLTRPFAIVPVTIFSIIWLQTIIQFAKDNGYKFAMVTQRVFIFFAIIFFPISAWWGIRYIKTEQFININVPTYHDKYETRRKETDFNYYLRYATSFHFKELIEIPNRTYDASISNTTDWKQSLNNSLWTVAYSDFWGDHWLYFSGEQNTEGKLWPKRVLFLYAFPITVIFSISIIRGVKLMITNIIQNKRKLMPSNTTSILFIFGFGLWLFWQTLIALEPGKNSGIKFIYNAYYFPFSIPVALTVVRSQIMQKLVLFSSILLYFLAIPISIYW